MVPYCPVEQYQFVQPFQPRRMRCTPQNGPSLKTVADIEVTRRIFRPNPSGYFQGFSSIYCGSKKEWNFVHKAFVHRGELEEHIKTLDAQKTSPNEGVCRRSRKHNQARWSGSPKTLHAQMTYLTKQCYAFKTF